MKKLRLYADTSVFGGCFDTEFEKESRQLFEEVRQGRFVLVVSTAVTNELYGAPPRVRNVLGELLPSQVEWVAVCPEATALQHAYLEAGIVRPASRRDAEHIATATVAAVDLLVSWNFKHIVHFDKIAGFNAINALLGYPSLRIFSPKEVVTL